VNSEPNKVLQTNAKQLAALRSSNILANYNFPLIAALTAKGNLELSFTIKKEIDIFALLAILISVAAFWQSYKSNDGYIVKGGGLVLVHPYKSSTCNVLFSIPVSYHNSGKRAVTLKRFIPSHLPKVMFTKSEKIITKVAIDYKFYILEGNITKPSEVLRKLEKTNEYPLDSYKEFGVLIKPNEVYEASIIITAQNYSNNKYIFDDIMVAVDVEFENGQILEHRLAIDAKKDILGVCGS